MKKITLLFALFAASFSFAQNGGDTCGAAVVATPGTYTATLVTDGSAGSEQGGVGLYDSAWFSFTPASDGFINVFSCLGGADTRLYIGTGTCGSLTNEISADDECPFAPDGSGFAYASAVTGFNVTSGTTYYIEWDDRWDAANPAFAFDWTLEFFACIPPTVASTTVVDDCGAGTFSVDIDFTDLGDSTTITISNDLNATTWNVTATGVQNVGPFPVDSNVLLTIAHETNTDCDLTGTFTDTCPPGNDECAGAVALTAGAVFGDNPLDSSVLGATYSGFTNSCGGTANMDNDTWYTVTIPNDGNITIEVGPDVATADLGFDSVVEAYTSDSDCTGTLTSVGCDDDGAATGFFSLLDLTGLPAGQTLYIRVWEFGSNQTEPFAISAYNATLSTPENSIESFKYFPNPVNDNLTLRAQNNIQNVAVYNMLGQEVMRMAPNAVTSEVDMSELSNGAYFVKVQINDTVETIRIIKK